MTYFLIGVLGSAVVVLMVAVVRLQKKAAEAWKLAHNAHTRLLPVETGLERTEAAVSVLSDAVAPIDRTAP